MVWSRQGHYRLEWKRSRRLFHVWSRRGFAVFAKARHGSHLPSTSSCRGWLRILLETAASHTLQRTELLWWVRQRRCHDECRRELAVFVPDPEAGRKETKQVRPEIELFFSHHTHSHSPGASSPSIVIDIESTYLIHDKINPRPSLFSRCRLFIDNPSFSAAYSLGFRSHCLPLHLHLAAKWIGSSIGILSLSWWCFSRLFNFAFRDCIRKKSWANWRISSDDGDKDAQ